MYPSVGYRYRVYTEYTEVSGTGIELLENSPICRVPVSTFYRTYRSVGYRYRLFTAHADVSGTGIEYRYRIHVELTEVSEYRYRVRTKLHCSTRFIVPLYNVYLKAAGRREYTFPVLWSCYISQRPGRSRYIIYIYIPDVGLQCLMPEAVEPGAGGSCFQWTRWCGWLASLRRSLDFAG